MNSVRFHVMDGLSSVRQPVSGFAAALFGNVGERPWAGFRLLAAAHAPIWTIRPSALYPTCRSTSSTALRAHTGGFAAFRNFETSNRLVKSGRSHMTAAVPYYRRYGLSDT